MTRVDELQKKYPNLAREIIVKWDVLRHGIKDSEVLDKVAIWDRAGSFQSRDLHGVTLQSMEEKRPGTFSKPGFVVRPDPFFMENGLGVRFPRALDSPYEIWEVGEDKFALLEGDEKVTDIYFPSPKPRNEEAVTSRGTPVSSLVSGIGHCFRIDPVRFCEYFSHGEQCKFCNYNSTYKDAGNVGIERAVALNLADTVEAFKIVGANTRLVEGRFQMGGFNSSEQEMKVYFDFVEQIASGTSYRTNIQISTQPMSKQHMQRLKDAGLTCVSFNLEVWDPEIFAEVCPGKAKHRGRERYLEAYQEAVEIFGWGSVGCDFVAGVSLMPDNGHKTWQDARDSHIEGNRWLIQHGVMPVFIALRLGVGSIYGDDPANREKLPPTEYLLEVAMAHHAAMLEYGLYDRLNRLLYCPMDCLSP
ncbi:MAG: hypothetical protein Q7O66_04030, partial [Dehalococcoidia bacterium]|nr:hypothetical protein [Dehalococcoidia bacterium]